MSLRDYDGWRRYSKWKRENYEAWERSIKKQEQMSDGLTETYKGAYQTHKKIPTTISKTKNVDKMPDQKWHRVLSFIKSGIRMLGYGFIPFNILTAVILLIVSEVVGIIEELV